jgi:hypothetical protein
MATYHRDQALGVLEVVLPQQPDLATHVSYWRSWGSCTKLFPHWNLRWEWWL